MNVSLSLLMLSIALGVGCLVAREAKNGQGKEATDFLRPSHEAGVSNDPDENLFDLHLTATDVELEPEIVVDLPPDVPIIFATEMLNLGSHVAVGDTGTTYTFVIRNIGTADLTGIALTKGAAHPDDFIVEGPNTSTLAPSASTSFTITFKPLAEGFRGADLIIASNDRDENLFNIQLSGNAFLPNPEIEIKGPGEELIISGNARINVGKVEVDKSGKAMIFTVKNTGTAALIGLTLLVSGKNPSEFVASDLKVGALAPGESTSFPVVFKPTAAGSRFAVIKLASNDADENPFRIDLSGTGVRLAPDIVVQRPAGTSMLDGGSMRFGTVVLGDFATQTVTIKNIGTAKLNNLEIIRNSPFSRDFTVIQPVNKSLAPGEFTTFKVTFKPSVKGLRKAALRIKSNDPGHKRFDIKVTGFGDVT